MRYAKRLLSFLILAVVFSLPLQSAYGDGLTDIEPSWPSEIFNAVKTALIGYDPLEDLHYGALTPNEDGYFVLAENEYPFAENPALSFRMEYRLKKEFMGTEYDLGQTPISGALSTGTSGEDMALLLLQGLGALGFEPRYHLFYVVRIEYAYRVTVTGKSHASVVDWAQVHRYFLKLNGLLIPRYEHLHGAVMTKQQMYAMSRAAYLTDWEHVYTNACDTVCDDCGELRIAFHTYATASDKTCDVCGYAAPN